MVVSDCGVVSVINSSFPEFFLRIREMLPDALVLLHGGTVNIVHAVMDLACLPAQIADVGLHFGDVPSDVPDVGLQSYLQILDAVAYRVHVVAQVRAMVVVRLLLDGLYGDPLFLKPPLRLFSMPIACSCVEHDNDGADDGCDDSEQSCQDCDLHFHRQ